MSEKLTLERVLDITIGNFRKSSLRGRVVTPITPLSEWDGIKRRGILIGIEQDLYAEGFVLESLTVGDVDDERKVGTSVGTFAGAVHGDLKAKDTVPLSDLDAGTAEAAVKTRKRRGRKDTQVDTVSRESEPTGDNK